MSKQPFRAGDAVEVLDGFHKGQVWVVAVYEAVRDEAHIAGWPYARVDKASTALRVHRAATDEQHAEMIASVADMRGEHGEGDPRRRALVHVQKSGGTP